MKPSLEEIRRPGNSNPMNYPIQARKNLDHGHVMSWQEQLGYLLQENKDLWRHIGGTNLNAIVNSPLPLRSMVVETADGLTEDRGDKCQE